MLSHKFFIVFWTVFSVLTAAGNLTAAIVMDGNRIMDQSMDENLCALTFDDGPSPNTPHLLDLLAENNIPATFFLLGSNAAQYPQIARLIKNAGHEIGNHTWSHPNLRILSLDRQREEIVKTDELLRSYGITPLYIRPPYGAFDKHTVSIASDLGNSLILWSLDSRDWKHLPSDYAKLLSTRGTIYDNGRLRGIFLFHDIHKNTVQDLPRIVANLRAGGCEKFVTVSDYLKGILDPEPAMLMTRRKLSLPLAEAKPMLAASKDARPLARCSRPLAQSTKPQPPIDLETAHAQAEKSNMINAPTEIN